MTGSSDIQTRSYDGLEEDKERKIDDMIKMFLSYQDTNLPLEMRESSLEVAKVDSSVRKYAVSLQKLMSRYGEENVMVVVQQLLTQVSDELSRMGIFVTPYGRSISWACWDIAKQYYYFNDPDGKLESKAYPRYKPGNPMEDKWLQNQILQRHIGWEVFSFWVSLLNSGQDLSDSIRLITRYVNSGDTEDACIIVTLFEDLYEMVFEEGEEGERIFLKEPPSYIFQQIGELFMLFCK